ncbi:MAG: formimidoylglutamate deiminase [Candidatus Andeanibacterium colombiense]|uniref:Formimidoylglutamate deiminase n=1 Tax=Candidatus Andeanibacterium colombiense TaxID=3121345 RepID=A0AAJ5X5T2_9SPHN|nr:MAG: formimidoylglutamate deiminase [Sphingomonadaceae bacterium]
MDADLHFGQALLPDGWARDVRVQVTAGRIAAVERGASPQPTDERQGYGLPGMPNLHSHAFQRGMAGLAERRGNGPDSFWTWRETMYRFVERMTPADVHALAALAYIEMLEGGFTRVGEFHYLHHDIDGGPYVDRAEMAGAIAQAALDSGIGLTLLPVFYAHSGFGGLPPGDGQRRFVNTIEGFARLLEASRHAVRGLPDAVVGIAAHSLRAVTPPELARLAALGGSAPLHIHVAEQLREVDDCLAWSGQRPVEWLLNHVDLAGNWCLVHATHIIETEVAALARSGAIAGLCPITEANLGDGIFPGQMFVSAGGAFGIGSDSNVLIDASEELRLLEYGQRLASRSRNVMGDPGSPSVGAALYRNACSGGAAALGAATGIAPGLPADLVSLDPTHPSLTGRGGDALLDGYAFAAGRHALDCVWRNGVKLVTNGRHRERDRIRERYRTVLEKLIA